MVDRSNEDHSSELGVKNFDSPVLTESPGYEIPELSKTVDIPEVSGDPVYEELNLRPCDNLPDLNPSNPKYIDNVYVNTTQQSYGNAAELYDN